MIKEKGQSLVELAISLVIIMFLLSGVVEIGIASFQFIQLRDAVQEGALYGSIDPTRDIEARVRGTSDSPLDLSSPDVEVLISTESGVSLENVCIEDGLIVEATYRHKVFMPFLSRLIGSEYIVLHAKVTDTILQPYC